MIDIHDVIRAGDSAEWQQLVAKLQSDLADEKHKVLNLKEQLAAAQADAAALRRRFGVIE